MTNIQIISESGKLIYKKNNLNIMSDLNEYGQVGDGAEPTTPVSGLFPWHSAKDRFDPVLIGTLKFKEIASGHDHSLGISYDGVLWSWGNSEEYKLGLRIDSSNNILANEFENEFPRRVIYERFVDSNGNITDYGSTRNSSGQSIEYIPYPVQSWKGISCSGKISLGIRTDGSLWTWGDGSSGSLGNGRFANPQGYVQIFGGPGSIVPEKIGSSSWKFADVGGDSYVVAIKSDGTLWSWGDNTYGQLGNGTKVEQPIVTGGNYTNKTVSPVQIGSSSNWLDVSAGYTHSLAIKMDGTLWVWGSNDNGQLGKGDRTESLSPFQIQGSWKKVVAGYNFSVGIKIDGTLWTWGKGGFNLGTGELQNGLGSYDDHLSPVQIDIGGLVSENDSYNTDWIDVSAGDVHVLARRYDGTLWAWGWGQLGQLGAGRAVSKSRHD